jgi:hypothetical protein
MQRSRERRQRLPEPLGEALGETVQEEVDRPRRLRRGGRSANGFGRFENSPGPARPAGEDRCSERLDVRLTG